MFARRQERRFLVLEQAVDWQHLHMDFARRRAVLLRRESGDKKR